MSWFRYFARRLKWRRETARWFRDGGAKSLLAGIENMKATAQGLGPDDPTSKAFESHRLEAQGLKRLQDLWEGTRTKIWRSKKR
tara:strand:+ start:10279 stop:10530 length:252 start_codon:yes stop_codon:yes gene_type:complete